MSKKREQELERLENYLMADEERQVSSARVYNRDKTDVNMKKYSEAVRKPKKSGSIWLVILILTAVLALFLYLVWGGQLPWN